MSILSLLYWIILVLSLIGVFAPPDWPHARRVYGIAWVALFVIIGLRAFKVPLQ